LLACAAGIVNAEIDPLRFFTSASGRCRPGLFVRSLRPGDYRRGTMNGVVASVAAAGIGLGLFGVTLARVALVSMCAVPCDDRALFVLVVARRM